MTKTLARQSLVFKNTLVKPNYIQQNVCRGDLKTHYWSLRKVCWCYCAYFLKCMMLKSLRGDLLLYRLQRLTRWSREQKNEQQNNVPSPKKQCSYRLSGSSKNKAFKSCRSAVFVIGLICISAIYFSRRMGH